LNRLPSISGENVNKQTPRTQKDMFKELDEINNSTERKSSQKGKRNRRIMQGNAAGPGFKGRKQDLRSVNSETNSNFGGKNFLPRDESNS